MGDNIMKIVLKLTLTLMVTLVRVRAVCDPDIPSRPMPKSRFSRDLSSEDVVSCTAGHYRNKTANECKACPDGTFMTAMMSSEKKHDECLDCLKPQSPEEIVATPCTSVRDTHIMCVNNQYRQEVGEDRCDWECKLCHVCGTGDNLFLNYEARSCGGYNNTVCCRHNNMIVVNNTCVEKPELSTSSTTTTTATTAAVTHSVTGIPNKENSGNTRDSSAFMLVTLCLMTISTHMIL